MFKKRVQKFSIRKLSIGAASVLLGTFFVGISNGNVDAATINNDGVEIQDKENNYEPTATVDKTEGDDTSSEPETRTHNGAIIETDDDTYIPEAVRKAHDSNPGAIIVANGNGEVTEEDNFDGGSIKPVLPSDTQDEESNYEPTAGSRQKTNVDETNSSEKTKLEENTQAQATISTNNVNSNLHKSNNYPDHLLTKVNKLQAKLAKENNSQNVVSLSTKSEEKLPQTSINKAETVILTTFGFIISIFGLADIRRKKN